MGPKCETCGQGSYSRSSLHELRSLVPESLQGFEREETSNLPLGLRRLSSFSAKVGFPATENFALRLSPPGPAMRD
jgi:hypothetical protein